MDIKLECTKKREDLFFCLQNQLFFDVVVVVERSFKLPSYSITQVTFNPLSPKIHIQILQSDLHPFLLRIVERIWFKIEAFSLVINLVILITFTLDDLLMLLGEN